MRPRGPRVHDRSIRRSDVRAPRDRADRCRHGRRLMRVLHVIPAVAARYGGPSTAIAAMCRAVAAVGVEPFIVATDADGPRRLTVPLGETTTWDGVPAVFFKRDWSESYKY